MYLYRDKIQFYFNFSDIQIFTGIEYNAILCETKKENAMVSNNI